MLPIVTILAVACHLALEGWRWQMIPVYALALLLVLRAAAALLGRREPGRLLSIVLLVLLLPAAALPALLPVPAISAPAGPFGVGTRSFELRDPARPELYSGKDEARRFMIQVWYPADKGARGRASPWMSDASAFAPAIAAFMNLPSFFLDHLALVRVPAIIEAPPASRKGGFPLLLFSHGWKGFDAQNTGQALLLASRGYVVVAVQHSYGAIMTVFPDGSRAPNNPAALPEGRPTEEYEIAARKLGDQWAGDLSFALDWMEARSSSTTDPFSGLVDSSKVGAWGHSTGGGAVIEFAARDRRCRAVLGMDPFMRPVSPRVLGAGLAQPSFFMFSQKWADDRGSRTNALFGTFFPHASGNLGAIVIRGTDHFDFSDLPLLTPLASSLGLKGPLPGGRVITIVDAYLLAFFEHALRGGAADLLRGPSPYPEVEQKTG